MTTKLIYGPNAATVTKLRKKALFQKLHLIPFFTLQPTTQPGIVKKVIWYPRIENY